MGTTKEAMQTKAIELTAHERFLIRRLLANNPTNGKARTQGERLKNTIARNIVAKMTGKQYCPHCKQVLPA